MCLEISSLSQWFTDRPVRVTPGVQHLQCEQPFFENTFLFLFISFHIAVDNSWRRVMKCFSHMIILNFPYSCHCDKNRSIVIFLSLPHFFVTTSFDNSYFCHYPIFWSLPHFDDSYFCHYPIFLSLHHFDASQVS